MKILCLMMLLGTAVAAEHKDEKSLLGTSLITKEMVVQQLTQNIDDVSRGYVASSVERVDSSRYEDFIKTCNELIPQNMDGSARPYIVHAVAKISPLRYEQGFTKTCNVLFSQYMRVMTRANMIAVVAKADPSKYEEFTAICKALIKPDMDGDQRVEIVDAVAMLPSSLWQSMVQFINRDPNFFSYVSKASDLSRKITEKCPGTVEELQGILNGLKH